MNFKTEFNINIQTSKDEDTYMKQLYEAVNRVVPDENKLERLVEINYLAKNRRNQVTINWKTSNEKDIQELVSNLKKEKWLRKHCITDIVTVY